MEDLERRSLDKLQAEVNNYFMMIKSELHIVWNALGDYLTGESSSIGINESTHLISQQSEFSVAGDPAAV